LDNENNGNKNNTEKVYGKGKKIFEKLKKIFTSKKYCDIIVSG